jgi:hypothetical protein
MHCTVARPATLPLDDLTGKFTPPMKHQINLTDRTALRQRARDNIQARARPAGCRADCAIVRTQRIAPLAACPRIHR